MRIRRNGARKAISILGLTALIAATLQVMTAPAALAAPAIFSDDFSGGNLSNWTTSTNLTIDNGTGSPAAPSVRAQPANQSAYAYLNLATGLNQACMSENVNLASGINVDLFRLRTATGGPIVKVFVGSSGSLRLRSDFASTTLVSGIALGTGWHNVELCGTVGTNSTWDLYRDGTRIVNAWAADSGTTPIGRIQIGDTAAKTFAVNFDHVVLDQAPGDDVVADTTPPSVPGRPAGSSPSAGSIQISWTASTDPAPASPPITYRVYRDGSATSIGSTTTTSFTDTGLASGSSHTYTVDAVDAANNASAKSQASLSITVLTSSDTTPPSVPGRPAGTSPSAGAIQLSWTASTDPAPASLPITYRIYRDGGATSIGSSATASFTDTGLVAGSSHTYTVDARDAVGNTSAKSQASSSITVSSATTGGGQPVPGHTTLVPSDARPNMPVISGGEITDLAYIGNRVFIVGGFSSIRNNTTTNTTNYNQSFLASYNIDTGLVDANFRPAFSGGGVTEVEASPDGTKLFVVGTFNTVNGVTKRKVASINPVTGATVTGFTANANSAGTSVEASNTTVYIGGSFTTINGTARVALAAVDANTGQVVPSFVNNLSGGIGTNGALKVQALALSHDGSKLLVVHTGRQVNGQDRYGMALIDTTTNQLLPWRSRLWDDNLQFVGGITRIYAGAIAPNDQYFVVTSGSGGDRPPISDTAVAFPMSGGDNVQPLWISRHFDSVYSVAISEVAVYLGGHFNYEPSPSAPDPWPGLTNVGYGRGQGLAGYGLGDDIVTRDHISAINPATGKALEFNPGSNSYEGDKALLVTPRGLFEGGDGNTKGGINTGRVAFYDFNTVPVPGPNETTITDPIEGRVEKADEQFVVDGTATAASGVNRVQLEITNRSNGRYLQDNLTSWGASNTINANLGSPNSTSSTWSLPLTISGNNLLRIQARTFGNNGSSDATKASKKFETFGLADETPNTGISGPAGTVIPTTTFIVTGTASDDVGVNSIRLIVRDAVTQRYLQNDGTTDVTYNTFRTTPDVIGATSATWSYEVTVPYEGRWTIGATAVDTAGQSDLREVDRTWIVSSTANPPTVAITTPTVMTPPTSVAALTMAPGSPVTFSGSATDDQDLANVEITLRNSTTRENLAADGTWGTGVVQGYYRVSPINISGTSYNWSYTTPFNLRPGTYSFTVRATDDIGLSTATANQGRLTINVQVPGDAFPDGLISPTGTQPNLQVLHLDLAGTATDDFGVSAVRLTIQDQDSSRYLQSNGTLAAGYALLDATLSNPGATNTAWSLSVNLPSQGNYAVTAFAFDTSGQQDPSTTGATATYPAYPGDQPPTVTEALFSPTEGMAFTDARIPVSGRVEDDQQIAAAQVAIRNSLGQYMSSTGTFTSTTLSWRTAFLNSPGSPGSNFSYTTPTIPAGSYTVFVRGVDQHGFATAVPSQRNVTVTVPPNNPPVANFTYSCTQNVCSFDGRSSTDENVTALTYSWSFGNGSGSGPVPTRTYTSASTYTVTLTVRDEYGVSSAPVSQLVTIVEPAGNVAPVPVINPPSCAALTCNISGVGSADPNTGDTFTYLWNFGDGTATSTSSAPAHTFPAPGTYTVTLTVTDGWGKAASKTLVITRTEPAGNVAPTPVINPVSCVGRVCTIYGTASSDPNGDAFTYLWNFGDGTATSTSSAPSHTFALAGSYTVTLTVTDGWGKAASITRVVTVT